MSQIQPAGGRLLQSLQSQASPSTQAMFAGTPVAPNTDPAVTSPVQSAPTDPTQLQFSTAVQSAPVSDPTVQSPDEVDAATKLAIFEEVLDEVEQGTSTEQPSGVPSSDPTALPGDANSVSASPQQAITSALDPNAVYQPSEDGGIFAQAIPTAVDQLQQATLQQQQQSGGRQKERLEGGTVAAPELPADMQYVEEEKNPEIPPEVESYIQHVEDAAKTQPTNVVIAQDQLPEDAATPAPPRLVKVLPITKEQEEVGLRKNTSFSIRWLVEFGHKLAKALVGQVVYKDS